jgi:serine/threonine protein kinase/Tfp pilus assembly protein PilF
MPFFGRQTLGDVLRGLPNRSDRSAGQLIDRIVPRGTGRRLSTSEVPADVPTRETQLRQLTFEELTLWIVAHIASGLEHAHQNGILHRDLKPANILVTDDGQPMILDFNLSDDVLSGSDRSLLIGGTIPYMAPEHLRAVAGRGQVDERSDVYAVGVILFQMLTGQLPFAASRDTSPSALEDLARQRSQMPTSPRRISQHLSYSVNAIVQRCLAPDPAQRYASAGQLRVDLERQLHHLPLQYAPDRSLRERSAKWLRRHPQVMSLSRLGAVATVLLLLLLSFLAVRSRQLNRLQAAQQYRSFQETAGAVLTPLCIYDTESRQRLELLSDARNVLAMYDVESVGWRSQSAYRLLDDISRQRLDKSLQELLYVTAWAIDRDWEDRGSTSERRASLQQALRYNLIAQQLAPTQDVPMPLLKQQARLAAEIGDANLAARAAQRMAGRAEKPESADFLSAIDYVNRQRHDVAITILERLLRDDRQDVLLWYLLARSYYSAGRFLDAESSCTWCVMLAPKWHVPYFHRGMCRMQLENFAGADDDFSESLRLHPQQTAAWFNRALARQQLGRLMEAANDFTQAIDRGQRDSLPYLLRGKVRRQLGDAAGSADDLQMGLRVRPTSVDGWIHRGMARLPDDPAGALADLDQALREDPRSVRAWRNRAFVMEGYFERYAEAITALDRVLELEPYHADDLVGRAVLNARLGRRDAAISDASRATETNATARTYYVSACALAQTSIVAPSDADRAVSLLAMAITADNALAVAALNDPDLSPISQRADFRQLIDATSTVRDMATSAKSAPVAH